MLAGIASDPAQRGFNERDTDNHGGQAHHGAEPHNDEGVAHREREQDGAAAHVPHRPARSLGRGPARRVGCSHAGSCRSSDVGVQAPQCQGNHTVHAPAAPMVVSFAPLARPPGFWADNERLDMRIVVAEDQLLLREGLVRLLEAHDVEVVAAVGDSREILPAIAEHRPDLALLDIRLPPTLTDEGLVAARAIRLQYPGHPVLMLSQYVEQLYVDELLADARGGVGYLLKDRVFDGAQFVADLVAVAGGGTVLDPDVVARLLQRRRHQDQLSRLSPRELEALALIAEGDSNAQVAAKMVVTEKSVSNHINSLLAKLDLPQSADTSRRVLAVLTYLRS